MSLPVQMSQSSCCLSLAILSAFSFLRDSQKWYVTHRFPTLPSWNGLNETLRTSKARFPCLILFAFAWPWKQCQWPCQMLLRQCWHVLSLPMQKYHRKRCWNRSVFSHSHCWSLSLQRAGSRPFCPLMPSVLSNTKHVRQVIHWMARNTATASQSNHGLRKTRVFPDLLQGPHGILTSLLTAGCVFHPYTVFHHDSIYI